MTLAQALALSLNTVSVRLTLEFGPPAVARTAHRLGIVSKLEPNASLALGTSEVSLLELVGAYAPFANGGFDVAPHVVERVRSADGKVLYSRAPLVRNRIIEPGYVAMMNQMMRETIRIGTARRAELPGWPVAGKTGTSQDFRDAWFVGFTGRLVAGVWFGNDDSSPTKKLTGGSLPVEAWSRFMKAAHHGVPVVDLPSASAPLSFTPPVMSSSAHPPPASSPSGYARPAPVPPAPIRPRQFRPRPFRPQLLPRPRARRARRRASMAGSSTGCGLAAEDSYAGLERARPDFAGRKPEQQGEASGGGDADDHRPGARSKGVADDGADGRADHLLHAANE